MLNAISNTRDIKAYTSTSTAENVIIPHMRAEGEPGTEGNGIFRNTGSTVCMNSTTRGRKSIASERKVSQGNALKYIF